MVLSFFLKASHAVLISCQHKEHINTKPSMLLASIGTKRTAAQAQHPHRRRGPPREHPSFHMGRNSRVHHQKPRQIAHCKRICSLSHLPTLNCSLWMLIEKWVLESTRNHGAALPRQQHWSRPVFLLQSIALGFYVKSNILTISIYFYLIISPETT